MPTPEELARQTIDAMLIVMNQAIRGITADFGPEHAATFRRDLDSQPHRMSVALVGQLIRSTTFQTN